MHETLIFFLLETILRQEPKVLNFVGRFFAPSQRAIQLFKVSIFLNLNLIRDGESSNFLPAKLADSFSNFPAKKTANKV